VRSAKIIPIAIHRSAKRIPIAIHRSAKRILIAIHRTRNPRNREGRILNIEADAGRILHLEADDEESILNKEQTRETP
jgi:hypothetical protein